METSSNRADWQDFPEPEFNELERALDRLEPAWADFAHGLRTGMRFNRDLPPPMDSMGMSLVAVRQKFDVFRARFESGGEPAALLYALKFAFVERVPVPSWVACAVRERLDRVLSMATDGPVSLHDAFGLREAVPLTPKRYAQARLYRRMMPRLYADVSKLTREGRSLAAALRQALRENGLTLHLTKAREMFEAQDRIQRQHLGKRPRRRSVK